MNILVNEPLKELVKKQKKAKTIEKSVRAISIEIAEMVEKIANGEKLIPLYEDWSLSFVASYDIHLCHKVKSGTDLYELIETLGENNSVDIEGQEDYLFELEWNNGNAYIKFDTYCEQELVDIIFTYKMRGKQITKWIQERLEKEQKSVDKLKAILNEIT